MPRPQTVIKIGEAAEILGVHVNTLRNWEAQGKIEPKMRFQGKGTRYYDRAEIEKLAALEHVPDQPLKADVGGYIGVEALAKMYDVSPDVIQALALDGELFGPPAYFREFTKHNHQKIREAIAELSAFMR